MSQAGYNLHVYVPLDAFQANEGRFLSGRGKYSGITSHYREGSPRLEHLLSAGGGWKVSQCLRVLFSPMTMKVAAVSFS